MPRSQLPHKTYCNFCGKPFQAGDSSRRCCSRGCAMQLSAVYNLRHPLKDWNHPLESPSARVRKGLLSLLREHNQAWVTEEYAVPALYGDSSWASHMALRAVISRTNLAFSLLGVKIEVIQARTKHNLIRVMRLESDVEIEATPSDAVITVTSSLEGART